MTIFEAALEELWKCIRARQERAFGSTTIRRQYMTQPTPHGTGPQIAPLVIADIETRVAQGVKTYGEPLKAFNGRDADQDLYEELLDAAIYAKQRMVEKMLKKAGLEAERLAPEIFLGSPARLTPPSTLVKVERQPDKESILQEAERLVRGSRGAAYGRAYDDFSRTAAMVSALLSDKIPVPLTARDIALVMICVKLSRESNCPKRDNRVDIGGYALCLDDVMSYQGKDLEKPSP